MNQEQDQKPTPTVPAEAAQRLAQWRAISRWAAIGRIWTGMFGITASVLATVVQSPYARYAAAASTVCFGLSAFASFEKVYFRYAWAWRVLDAAILRFRYDNAPLGSLLQAIEKGEAMVQELEEEQSKAEHGVGRVRPPKTSG